MDFRQTSNISCSLEGFADHSYVVTCRHCSNYIFIIDLTPGFNKGLGFGATYIRYLAAYFVLRISSKSQLVSFVRCYIGRISVCWNMVTSSNWKKNPRYWSFVRGIRWSAVVPLTKAIDAEFWCFLWYVPEQTVEQTVEMLVIWDAIAPFYDVTVIFLGLSSVIRTLWRDLMTSTFFLDI